MTSAELSVRGWRWEVGNCASCEARGVPVASNDYYTTCAGCLRRVAGELDEKKMTEGEVK